jgi:AraC-like DNA-binding protein
MTKLLESPFTEIETRETSSPAREPVERSFREDKTWGTIVAFQKLQRVFLEGRSEEKERACADFLRKVRLYGGDPQPHFHYALGFLTLALSQRDPERARIFEGILSDFQSRPATEEVERAFRRGLERLFALALKPRAGVAQDRLERVRDFIQVNFQSPIRLERVARDFGFSTSSLGRRFKENFGKGFSAFLRDLRVEKAKELLIEGRLPVEQVSRESGFRNFHYFFEVFKKVTGKTPQKFRRSVSGLSDKN